MATGSTPPERPFEPDPELSRTLDAVRGLGAGRFEVLGPLGQDRNGEYAFLARGLAAGRLVVLKRRLVGSPHGTNSAVLEVIEQLDASVPPPAGSCTFCHTPFGGWEPSCPECGADLADSNLTATTEADRARLLDAVRAAAPTFEVLGDMPRAAGGGIVFFAREPQSGHLVALRLEAGAGTVAATRMMRPHMTYGSVGGDAPGAGAGSTRSRPWAPIASPSVPLRSGFGRTDAGTGPGGQGTGPSRKVCPLCGETFETEARFCPRDGAALRSAERTGDLVGQVIAERYHILRMLGEGGMGRVYLAEHVRMGRTCAVKVMNPKLLNDADSVSRFSREAANASRITHPNVAAIYDFGEAEDVVYIAMEYVDGPSLAEVMAKEGRLDQQRVIGIGAQVAEALIAAHDFGIVHRDLKPDNVMLTRSRSGQDLVKVVDFGIAKATQGGRQTVTRTGFVIGTPAYMSPEQILGDVLDGRSDIYSLGCILYEMLTGERVFAGSSGEVSIHQRLTEPAPRPRVVHGDISDDLDDVVFKALARSPDQRFQSAVTLRDALIGAVVESADAPSRGGTTVLRHRSQRSEGPRVGWLLAACLGLVGIGVAGWMWWVRPQVGQNDSESIPLPATPSPAPSPAPAPPAPGPSPGSPVESVATAPPPASTVTAQTPASEPAPAPAGDGTLAFDEALPPGALVTVDGRPVDVSADGTVDLPAGRRRVAIRAPGYRAFNRTVRVAAGQSATLSPRLVRDEPAPEPADPAPERATPAPAPAPSSPGTIVIQGNLPEGAALDVDGRPLAIGVRSANAAPGPHWVRISVPGYRSDSSLVQVVAGQETEWRAPSLIAMVKPVPQPAAPQPAAPKPAPSGGYGTPEPAPSASLSESQVRAEIVTLLADYQMAINTRDLDQLKAFFPAMPAESERRWKDLFGKDVNDLVAVVTLTSIVPASAAQIATFKLLLTFKPTGGKTQKYQLTNVGTLRREAGGWRFLDLVETGN
ncbi:MAG: serine/threonine-protein kinase [Gemmatimonadales bacterium]